MLESVLLFIIFFFAIYGALSLTIGLMGIIRQKGYIDRFKTKLVIIVKNQEDTIEGIVRTTFMENFLRKVMSKDRLTVLDMGSTDGTMEILDKLKEEYKYMDVLTEGERDNIFEGY